MNTQFNWEEPIPLDNVRVTTRFPVECLPQILRDYAISVSESTATPVDMSAVASLSVIAGAVQGKYQVMGKSDYFEPLNLYTIIIAKPAERKSAIIRAMTKFLSEYEKTENFKIQTTMDKQTIDYNIKLKQIAKIEEESKIEEAYRLKAECREIEQNGINQLRLIADDITPESLTSLLADNKGRLSIISSEGGVFDTLAGKYSNIVSIDTVLKAHIGDTITVDRKGRNKEYIPNPTLTILLTVQENVLEGLISNGVFRGRGLTGRFLYCQPISNLGTRKFDTPPISKQVEDNYKKLLFKLLDIPFGDTFKILTLSDNAYKLLKDFFNWVEPQLVDELENMSDWAGKLVGTNLRIAGILHCADYDYLMNNTVISGDTMKKAIKISKYFLEHAKSAYQLMGADKVIQEARYIISQLLEQNKEILKRCEIHRCCRGKFQKAENMQPALDLLIDYNYLYEEEQKKEVPKSGRPSDTRYILNPFYFNKSME